MTYRYVSPIGLRIGQIALLVEAIVRGINYIRVPPAARNPILVNVVEASAPVWVWGTLFITLGVVGLYGEAWLSGTETSPGQYNPRAWPSFIAHSALMCAYIGIALGATLLVARQHPGYGWLDPYDLYGLALANWIFARLRRDA